MSKAFTKESDDGPFDEAIPEPRDLLPEGAKNYVTEEGAKALEDELAHLEQVLRPQAVKASKGKGAEPQGALSPKRRLEAIDRRARFLRNQIANMVIVDLRNQDPESVHFGARVTVADEEGHERAYQIVGVDESDPAHGKISWISPIGKALISTRVGDIVRIELPDGASELEVLEIEY
jgi:transcription elongation factor GreB